MAASRQLQPFTQLAALVTLGSELPFAAFGTNVRLSQRIVIYPLLYAALVQISRRYQIADQLHRAKIKRVAQIGHLGI